MFISSFSSSVLCLPLLLARGTRQCAVPLIKLITTTATHSCVSTHTGVRTVTQSALAPHAPSEPQAVGLGMRALCSSHALPPLLLRTSHNIIMQNPAGPIVEADRSGSSESKLLAHSGTAQFSVGLRGLTRATASNAPVLQTGTGNNGQRRTLLQQYCNIEQHQNRPGEWRYHGIAHGIAIAIINIAMLQ